MQHIKVDVEAIQGVKNDMVKSTIMFMLGKMEYTYIGYGSTIDVVDNVMYLRMMIDEAVLWVNAILAQYDVMIHLPDVIDEM